VKRIGSSSRPAWAAILSACLLGCSSDLAKEEVKTMPEKKDPVTRQAVGSGRWFPGDKSELSRMVSGYIDDAGDSGVSGTIFSALSPHAGFVYSGKVAGHTFRALKDAAARGKGPDTVVIAGFGHSQGFPGVALMDGDSVETPLGETPIDKEANRLLASSSDAIQEDYRPHYGEHSAENQIPFVQSALPDAKLVVAIMGDHDLSTVDAFVAALKRLSEEKRVLLVASTDLLHDPDYEKVTRTDKSTLENITQMKDRELVGSWSGRNQVCCGIMPVITAMRFAAAMGCRKGRLLHYRNSGDDFPESRGEWVVGYGAVVFAAE
jgi:AmmeMemoRadiSam system protein B